MQVEVRHAVTMAEELIAEHGLEGWRVVVDRAKTRAGICREGRREIGLSGPLTVLHDETEVRDTVLHEIAHALVGTAHGHDAVWRAAARAIGCSGQRTTSAPKPPGRWSGSCPAGHTCTRHRRPSRVVACGRCGTSFSPENLMTWSYDGHEVALSQLDAGYQAQWQRLQASGATPVVPALAVGSRVRLTGGGPHSGVSGTIVRRGRTRYHVRTAVGTLTAPFVLVEPLRDKGLGATRTSR